MMTAENRISKILVVDDEPALLLLIKSRLESHKYQVFTAYHGVEGLQTVKREKPDLVLLDILMPGMDGFEFLEKMKALSDVKSIPIIMLSAKAQQDDIDKAMGLGAKDYVVKPFTPELLLKKIQEALKKR